MYYPLKLYHTMPFGKHKGEQVEDLIYDQPDYITWLAENTDIEFAPETMKLMEEKKLV